MPPKYINEQMNEVFLIVGNFIGIIQKAKFTNYTVVPHSLQ